MLSNASSRADAALSSDRPLLLPRGSYAGPLTIDYSAHAGTGFELISRGATINGTLAIECSTSCFYFHQEGTLLVNANDPGPAVMIGQPDFSDAQNSIRIDHLIANNSGSGAAIQLNYVLGSQLFVVADGGQVGLDVRQLQFSSEAGAASASAGTAMMLRDGYVIADTFTSLDLEASPVCLRLTSPNMAVNTWLSPYMDCPIGEMAMPGTQAAQLGLGGVVGGKTVTPEMVIGQ